MGRLFPDREIKLGGHIVGLIAIGAGCIFQLSQGHVEEHFYGQVLILFGLALIALSVLAGFYRAMLVLLRIVLAAIAMLVVAGAIIGEFYRR